MNAIVPGSRIALGEPRWFERLATAVRTWASQPAHADPLPFADADDVIRQARAERAAYLRSQMRRVK